MKITDFLSLGDIIPNLSGNSMDEVLRELAQHLVSSSQVPNSEQLVEVLLEREKLGSTGIGNGVAIPHGRLSGIQDILVVFGRSTQGIEFHAHDQKLVFLLFLLVAPEDSAGKHLKALARISRILKSPDCRRALMESDDRDVLYRVISEEDERH